ncbi:biotin--[acetyl-CoA-carboxylase] ligase [bacterium]|nr:biotin--[acetyl-CoA-carboxylase] ligase [bacterium]MBU1652461.1 biotin--[acetyl-CoA-carboxylase] ligase [bacterium]
MAKVTFGKTIIRLGTVTSTQDILKESFHQGVAEGAIAIADGQTLGKGRQGRTWDSAAGKGLWLSTLIEPSGPEALWTWVPLWAGIIVRDSILQFIPDKQISRVLLLKWPNDLYIEDRKLGGILAEKVQHKSGRSAVIVGIGLNLKQQRDDFPPHLRNRAASLTERTHVEIQPEQILENLIEQAEQNVHLLKPIDTKAIEKAWMTSAWGLGEQFQVISGDKVYEGRFIGLGPHGEMCLEDSAGKVIHLASSDGISKVTSQ